MSWMHKTFPEAELNLGVTLLKEPLEVVNNSQSNVFHLVSNNRKVVVTILLVDDQDLTSRNLRISNTAQLQGNGCNLMACICMILAAIPCKALTGWPGVKPQQQEGKGCRELHAVRDPSMKTPIWQYLGPGRRESVLPPGQG